MKVGAGEETCWGDLVRCHVSQVMGEILGCMVSDSNEQCSYTRKVKVCTMLEKGAGVRRLASHVQARIGQFDFLFRNRGYSFPHSAQQHQSIDSSSSILYG